ncbi:tRNA lysidine(34) synthetase TilS [Phenylobacterium sp. J367]|uniref:tRNA lysidine(34) synthetase TilS n=1 Tax=Phenylobacterium sp. J367 TaxID=2898435 RepID=UPI0027E26642|nr:tRNA lysidine(34) synthetase TilS [Phenylobacterium sp. J367]
MLADDERPLAVALSGGGDSLALTLLAAEWGKQAGRPILVLTVDHGLQRQSAAWTQACAETARRLGADFRALAWTGAKPGSGLAAAAREARHRLLADAARQAGARVILMGHTASDVAEAAAMRAAGSTTPAPREWAPSPAWPEGRGLFVLRPMLSVTRAAIRDWLTARGETWIDDPANSDLASARVRARAADPPPDEPPGEPALAPLAEACRFDAAGGVTFERALLRGAEPAQAATFLAMAAVCAGGGDRRPASDRVERLRAILAGGAVTATTLAGARIEADAEVVRIFREPGEAKRGGLPMLYLTPGKPVVWDGRFELTAARDGLRVDRLEGLMRKLPPDQQAAVAALPAKARGGLPAVTDGPLVVCPAVTQVVGVECRSLVAERLLAACGLLEREPF